MSWPDNVCPICNELPTLVGRDFFRHSHCKNDHIWHTCTNCQVIVKGKRPKISLQINDCSCPSNIKEIFNIANSEEANLDSKSIDEIFKYIHGCSRLERKTILEMLGKLAEETGEVAQEILISERSPGMTHKEPSEDGILGECVDTIIVAACIAFKTGASIEQMSDKFVEKLNKWKKVSINNNKDK